MGIGMRIYEQQTGNCMGDLKLEVGTAQLSFLPCIVQQQLENKLLKHPPGAWKNPRSDAANLQRGSRRVASTLVLYKLFVLLLVAVHYFSDC